MHFALEDSTFALKDLVESIAKRVEAVEVTWRGFGGSWTAGWCSFFLSFFLWGVAWGLPQKRSQRQRQEYGWV